MNERFLGYAADSMQDEADQPPKMPPSNTQTELDAVLQEFEELDSEKDPLTAATDKHEEQRRQSRELKERIAQDEIDTIRWRAPEIANEGKKAPQTEAGEKIKVNRTFIGKDGKIVPEYPFPEINEDILKGYRDSGALPEETIVQIVKALGAKTPTNNLSPDLIEILNDPRVVAHIEKVIKETVQDAASPEGAVGATVEPAESSTPAQHVLSGDETKDLEFKQKQIEKMPWWMKWLFPKS